MRKILIVFLTMVFLTSTVVHAGGWTFANSSDWAEQELGYAMSNGITMQEYDDYQRDITRGEFAELVMNLYYQTKGTSPQPASGSTFKDTSDDNILRAYRLGIINGKGNGIFAPNAAVTRQEMAIMIKRAIDSMSVDYIAADGKLTVSDKNQVASWAVDGVDFAFENGFMKGDGFHFNPLQTTPVEQAVIIVNRVYEKYKKNVSSEPNDYSKGYTTQITSEGLLVTYNNNGQSEVVVSLTGANPQKGGGSMNFGGIKDIKTINKDLSKIYFLDSMNRMWSYDFNDETCYQYRTSHGGALNVQEYEVVSSGQYYGYVAVESLGYVSKESKRYVYDRYGTYLGELEMMTDLNYQISEIYNQEEEEADKFAIQVNNAVNFPGDLDIDEDFMYFFSNANHQSFVKDGVGYLRMYPYYYDDDAYTGPMGRAGSKDAQVGYNGYGGIYQVDMTFNNEIGNAGIVFNLVNASDGNDNYRGYYVGISPEEDTVTFGKSEWKWTNLKEVPLGFDVEKGDTVTLQVTKNGTDIWVSVNGHQYIDMTDKTFSKDGGFGIRSWKCDVSYSNYTIKPLPY
ncbi:S-layer homology domain-containing protein [Petroclostridium sp. X23]|uniref:S-layer homology domain-containing protein n=1 Tax=Petroclostridium sp. X23 TaxID=3045146 RepID=UPI0024AE1F6F|nr:S-layer homology domain-containing protein [Petroclostridium sp. X23]WHH60962.1 S-layer homology domain-containing protein [Petroclostridium sp. X23]